MTHSFDSEFIEIAKKIADYGGRMYLVGGAVRDAILNQEIHDMDFCVTGLTSEELSTIFNAPRIQGKEFPVFIINGCEFALARKERKSGHKHTDFEIITDKNITIEEDLSRRDLTINSMAIDVLTNELIDPFNGKKDLENRTLRMTTEAYSEDPLRVYRTARFAAKFEFSVGEETLKMMESMKPELISLSAERICAELMKALKTNKPSLFFEVLRMSNTLDVHFKELADLIGVEQPVKYHPEGDAYVHTLDVLDRVSEKSKNNVQSELIKFCALVHDFGKGVTPKNEWPHHYNHEENGVDVIHNFCKRIRMPKIYEKAGVLTSSLHMKAGLYDSLKSSTKVKMFKSIADSKSLSYEGMEIIASCDSKKEIKFSKVAREVMKLGVTPEIKEKCTDDLCVFDYEKAKQIVLNKRIELIKELERPKITINSIKKSINEFDKNKELK